MTRTKMTSNIVYTLHIGTSLAGTPHFTLSLIPIPYYGHGLKYNDLQGY